MASAITHLRDQLSGELIEPGDPGYDQARRVWNAMVDRRPRLIVRCASVPDVVAGIRFARDVDIEIGVRCGGHSVVGHAVPDGGLMLDLIPMGSVRVDPQRRRAYVQGGALLGALDAATQAYGLATTAGNVSHTGVGGLTLGGGMGWLARRYGLSCDNVESFEVVTADGDVLRASQSEYPDLYWALRGGGGNFGVVTEFVFRLHATGDRALLVEHSYPLEEGAAVLRGWRDWLSSTPRQAAPYAFVGGEDAHVSVGYVWVGDQDEGRLLVPELRGLGRRRTERVVELSYVDVQRIDDTIDGHEQRRYWKGHYLYELTDAAIDAFVMRGTENGRGHYLPDVSFQAHGGAIAEIPAEDTAFAHRDTLVEYVASAGWTDPSEDGPRMAAARATAAALEPYAAGVYVNALADEGMVGVRRAYSPEKLARLTRVKDRYDPHNVFHLNPNIPPSPAGPA